MPREPGARDGMAYRPDIDGLRAVAVLAVVAFHAVPQFMPGGYTGVDVFFVISGYLITGLILADMARGAFTLPRFYARRVRRIFPALITVLGATLMLGWYFLLAHEFDDLLEQTGAASAFVLNFLLAREAGYFDAALETSPLLHLWSLSIEEQFYIAWPLLIVWMATTRHSARMLAGSLLLASFALNVALVSRHGTAAFFLLPTRWWELMAGGLLAWNTRVHAQRVDVPSYAWVRDATCIIGLCLIAAGFMILDRERHYPGGWALLPVVGTCCVVAAGPRSAINRIVLAHRWAVAIGLISYPLYLWHWPLLTLLRIVEGGEIGPQKKAIAVLVSLALAAATYRLIERPIRARRSSPVAIPLLLAMVLLGAAATMGAYLGWPPRANDSAYRRFDLAAHDWDFPGSTFHARTLANGLNAWGVGSGSRKILFYGDSDAQQYGPRVAALLAAFPTADTEVLFATTGSCPPIRNVVVPDRAGCPLFADRAMAAAMAPDVETVIIAAQWMGYVVRDARSPAAPARYGDTDVEAALSSLQSMVRDLVAAGKRVVVVLNIPVGRELDPRYVLHRSWSGDFDLRAEGIDRRVWNASVEPVVGKLATLARAAGALIIDPVPTLCDADRCPSLDVHGEPMYRDGYHLRASFMRDNVHYLDRILLDRANP